MINTDKFENQITALLEKIDFNGCFLASKREAVLFSDSFGFANAELKVKNTSKTKFRIGSLTKQFTALAILQLVQKGKISLDSTLERFVSDYYSGTNITIHHLLSHTSGIYNFSNRNDIMEWYKTSSAIQETINSVKHIPMDFKPGEGYEYSNSNYLLLSYIIEQVSGPSYEEYLQKYIINILEMNHTRYDQQSEIINDRASGYYYEDGLLKNAPYINMNIPQGAGGLLSTIEDLHKWNRGLTGTKLLSEELKTVMYTSNLNNYAYGWMVQQFGTRKVVYHTGGIHGFSSFICRFPEDDVCVIALSNYSQDIGGIAVQVSQMILE